MSEADRAFYGFMMEFRREHGPRVEESESDRMHVAFRAGWLAGQVAGSASGVDQARRANERAERAERYVGIADEAIAEAVAAAYEDAARIADQYGSSYFSAKIRARGKAAAESDSGRAMAASSPSDANPPLCRQASVSKAGAGSDQPPPVVPAEGAADGVTIIKAERSRQLQEWGSAHDDGHGSGELAIRAAELAVDGTDAIVRDTAHDADCWGLVAKYGYAGTKPNRVRALTIAGALIAAELDRAMRASVGKGAK